MSRTIECRGVLLWFGFVITVCFSIINNANTRSGINAFAQKVSCNRSFVCVPLESSVHGSVCVAGRFLCLQFDMEAIDKMRNVLQIIRDVRTKRKKMDRLSCYHSLNVVILTSLESQSRTRIQNLNLRAQINALHSH